MQVLDFPITLQAGVPIEAGILSGADFIAVITSPNALEIKIGQGSYTEYSQGDVLRGESFDKIFLKSATAQAIKLKAGQGDFSTKPPVTVGTVNATIEPTNTLFAPGDATAATLASLAIAANAQTKEVELCLPSTATNPVRVGPAGVTAASGSILEPGSSKFYAVESDIYVVRTAAPDETVTVLAMRRP